MLDRNSQAFDHHSAAARLAQDQRSRREALHGLLHAAAKLPFIEVFVNTPIATCEQRDPKGLYKKARAGELKGFTGVDDPYETPASPELTLDATGTTPQQGALLLIEYLEQQGIIPRL